MERWNALSYCGFNYKDYLELKLSVAFAILSLRLGT